MHRFLRAARSVGAVVAGYLTIVLGTVLVLEVALGGISYRKSSAVVLLAAAAGTFLSGIAGGWIAAWLAGRNPVEHGMAVILPLIVDTSFVIFGGLSNDPLWFDLGGSGLLMAGAVLGGYLRSIQLHRAHPPEALADG